MKDIIAMVLVLSVFTVGCKDSGGGGDSGTEVAENSTRPGEANPEDPETPDSPTEPVTPPPVSTVPALALSFQTNVDLLNLTETQTEKYNRAVAIVKKVVGTEAFRKAILNHTYNGVKQFVDNKGLSNAEIYQSILEAAERLTPAKNNTMDLGVKLYYENSNTVGWTSSGSTYINVNTKYFNTYKDNNVASNLFHEWLHKLGYSHDAAATTRRPYSVPYAVGYIIGDLGKSFL